MLLRYAQKHGGWLKLDSVRKEVADCYSWRENKIIVLIFLLIIYKTLFNK